MITPVTFPDLTTNAWVSFLVIGFGFVLMLIGYRMGRVKTGAGVSVELERVDLPLIWAGVAVLIAGALYGLVVGIARAYVVGIVSSLIQIAVYAWVVVMIERTRRRVRAK